MVKHEIFISYAHADNALWGKGAEGWIDLLHRQLSIRLHQLLGREVTIWRDIGLSGNADFAAKISAGLSSSAILVAVLSPSYLNSDWCTKERTGFCAHAQQNGGLRLNDRSRIFKVIKTFLPRDRHPQEVQDSLGYEFYEYNKEKKQAPEFNPYHPEDVRYWSKLEDLAWDLKTFIESLPTDINAKTIYLAETTSDLLPQRDEIRRELLQRGHIVLPDGDLPLRTMAQMEAINRHLQDCNLAIHLIGETPGNVKLQYELAAEQTEQGKLVQLIWMPAALHSTDTHHQTFIEEINSGLNRPKNTELLKITLEDLKTRIHDKLTAKPKLVPLNNGNGANASVYLICDKPDYDSLHSLQDGLYELGLEAILSPSEGDEALISQYHKEMLLDCDAVMIHYGSANPMWLQMKLRELQKLAGYGREKPMLAKAVYISAPQTDQKLRFRTHEAMTITNFGAFDPVVLTPFVDQIRQAKGAL